MKNLIPIICLLLLLGCQKTAEIKRQQLFLKGNIALAENELKQAVYYYSECIEMNDTIPAPYNNRAIAYEKMGDYQEAFSDYERAILLSLDFYEAYFNRAKLFNELQNYKSALMDLQQIESAYSDSASFYFVKGISNTGLKRFKEAEGDFGFAGKLQPQNEEIQINLATVYYYSGKYDLALNIVSKVLENKKIHEALNLKALLLVEFEKYDSAIMLIDDALKTSSNSFYYNNRGYVKLLNGQLEEGINDINQSLLMDDQNPWAYRNKGIYFYMVKEYKQALNFLNTSLQFDPQTNKSNYYLGLVYQELGEMERACENWQESTMLREKEGAALFDKNCASK